MAIVPIQFEAQSIFCLLLWTKKDWASTTGCQISGMFFRLFFSNYYIYLTTFTSTNLHVKRIMLQQKSYSTPIYNECQTQSA